MDNRDVVILNIIAIAVLLEVLYEAINNVIVFIKILILVIQRQVNVG